MATGVRVGKLPGKIQTLDVEEGATIGQVIAVAQINPEGYEIRYNGSPADLQGIVKPGDTILLVRTIAGN